MVQRCLAFVRRQVFECLRRLVLTGVLVFLVPETPGQVAFSCVFAFTRYVGELRQESHNMANLCSTADCSAT